jgi:acylphosphatase
MKARYIVHGFVQGVGYRAYVKGIADRLGVDGSVENQDDGSVLIIADADKEQLDKFESDIDISIKYGAQVQNIEKTYEEDESAEDDDEENEGAELGHRPPEFRILK